MTATDTPGPRKGYRISEAQELLGVSDDTIRAWLAGGVLRGRKVGSVWVISAKSVEEFFDDGHDDPPAVASLAARLRAHEERLERLEARLAHDEAS